MSSERVDKLAYFPVPYPGELLYSLIARYARHMAVPSASRLKRDLFGTGDQRPSFDLPNNVRELARRIPSGAGLTGPRLVRRHTLFPYYRALSPLVRSKSAIADMLGAGTDAKALANIGPYIPRIQALRFCDRCAAEMLGEHGELYWRRDHQLPGTLACTWHERLLRSSEVKVGWHATAFEAATEATCVPDAPTVLPGADERQLAILLALAEAGSSMLRLGRWAWADDSIWRSHFHALCRRKGVLVGGSPNSRRIITDELTKELSFLERAWPRLFDDGACGRWTKHVDRIGTHAMDPVLRLLANEAIKRMPDRGGRFGSGPWPCLNPLSGHFREDRIGTVRIRSVGRQWIGTFACACGYVYTRSAYPDGRITGPRLKEYGPALTRLICESFECGRGITATSEVAQIGVPLLIVSPGVV